MRMPFGKKKVEEKNAQENQDNVLQRINVLSASEGIALLADLWVKRGEQIVVLKKDLEIKDLELKHYKEKFKAIKGFLESE